jgi:hypothetical protein
MPALQDRSGAIAEMDRRKLDPAGLAGRWVNTNAHGNGVQEITIDANADAVELLAVSTANDGLCSWGTTRADMVYGADANARNAMAFTARYNLGGHRIELQGNMNLGLLVVASFNYGGAAGYSYFAREFYRSGDRATAPAATPWSASSGRVGGDDPDDGENAAPGLSYDGSEMFGDWWNTNPDSKGIARLRIDSNAQNGAVVRLWGASAPGPVEWGSAQADLFALSSGSRLAKAFSARYQAHDANITLQANIKQGVLVVASFAEFSGDDGRSNYFHREFYYRS